MLEAQLRNPAQRFLARVRQVCYEVRAKWPSASGPPLCPLSQCHVATILHFQPAVKAVTCTKRSCCALPVSVLLGTQR